MNPSILKTRYNLISSLIMSGQWEEASEHADQLLNNPKNYFTSDYFNIKGFILLWQAQPEEAFSYFRKALKMEPNNNSALLNAGVAMSLIAKSGKAEFFLNKAIRVTPGDIRPFYALIEHSVRAGDLAKTQYHTNRLFERFSIQEILEGIDTFSNDYRTAPFAHDLIVPVIRKKLIQISRDLLILHAEYTEYREVTIR